MKKILVSALLFLVLAAFSSCNTVQGVGKDIQSGGKALERAGDTKK